MCIVLHCRILLLLPSTPSCIPFTILPNIPPSLLLFGRCFIFVQPSLAHPDAMLVWFIPVQLTAEPMWRTDNKAYQHILFKVDLLSCFPTAVGPKHKPLLPNRVLNPWWPKSGTQCGAYGWWTGLHTHRCKTQLLGDIAGHPQLRQHHQLSHVDCPAANSRNHTKNDFFPWKNICQCMTFAVRPTGQHQAVCNTIADTNSAGGVCPVTIRGHCDLFHHNPLHSHGEHGDHEEPHSKEGSSNFILRWIGSLSREMVPGSTRVDEE